jgi:hypothetical protein
MYVGAAHEVSALGVRRGQHFVALMVDIPLIRRDPCIRLCHYPLTLIPSKRSSGIQSST